MSIARARRALPALVVVIAATFFCVNALHAIDKPGLHYDEVAFVNAALGAHYPDQHFVHARFHGRITKIFPYIGALKSWTFEPIFKAFGVSMESIRIPAVLLALLTIGLAAELARRLFGTWPAVLLTVLLCTDPTFAAMAKTDFGPMVHAAMLRVLALIALFALVRRQQLRYAWVLALALVLGTFHKVDYLWFVGALGAGALLVYGREFLSLVRSRPLAAALPVVAFAAVMAVLFSESILPAQEIPAPAGAAESVGDRLDARWDLYENTFSGRGFLAQTTGIAHDGTFAATLYVGALVAAFGLLAAWFPLRRRLPREPMRLVAFLAIAIVAMAVCLVATRQVGGAHHMIQLWPLPELLLVALLVLALRIGIPRLRLATAALVVLLAGWVVVQQIALSGDYREAWGEGERFSRVWTPEIYELSDVAGELAPELDGIVAADWGVGPQVFALNGGKVRSRLRDLPPDFSGGAPGAKRDQIATDHFRGRRVLVMFHQYRAEVFAGSSRAVARVIDALGPHARVQSVYQGEVLRGLVVDDRVTG
jgi:hypothetical protein